tara:strand:- start:360 stop:1214 length:855 start_codon:yes stop_codon:yes gene_type:complete
MKVNKNFAVFIMVHGRPDRMKTYQALRRHGYTGQIFLVADNLDKTVNDYKKIYNDKLLVFDKKEAALKMDTGDNTGDLRSTLFAANTIFKLAKDRKIKYFYIMCDDYTSFAYRFNSELKYEYKYIFNLDKVFKIVLEYYKNISAKTIAFSQGGDFIGGSQSQTAKEIKLKRKAMNTFLCSTDRTFKFVGRLNEDVTTYVNLGSTGDLFLTIPHISITQQATLQTEGGLTDVYLEYGTYIKSFMSVIYNPSCIKISEIGSIFKRIHHKVKWNNAVPKILNEKHKK